MKKIYVAAMLFSCLDSGLYAMKGGEASAAGSVITMDRLPFAVICGHVETVRSLLDMGANVNAHCRSGATALHYAAGFGGVEIVRLLLSSHANERSKDKDSGTPLHYAIIRGIQSLGWAPGSISPWEDDIPQRSKETLDVTLDTTQLSISDPPIPTLIPTPEPTPEQNQANIERKNQANIERRNEIAKNYMEIIQLLLEKGADVNVQRNDGRTALHLAAFLNKIETVRYLVKQHADPCLCDQTGKKPLDLAADNLHDKSDPSNPANVMIEFLRSVETTRK